MKTDTIYWLLVIFVLLAATASCAPAHAGTYVYTGAWSHHIGNSSTDYNEDHDLVAVEHKRVVLGQFKNSYNRRTEFAAYRFTDNVQDIELGVMVGAMYGYTSCSEGHKEGRTGSKLCPLIVPSAVYTRYRVQPGVMLMGTAFAVTVRFEL